MSDLPPTTIEMHALGHFVRVMARRDPAVLDEWVDSLQDEALLNEIIRLRGPRDSAHVREVREGALAWALHVRLVTLAMMRRSAVIKPPRPARRPGARARHPDSA